MRPVTPPSYDGGSTASDNEGDDNDLMETFIIMEYCEGGVTGEGDQAGKVQERRARRTRHGEWLILQGLV